MAVRVNELAVRVGTGVFVRNVEGRGVRVQVGTDWMGVRVRVGVRVGVIVRVIVGVSVMVPVVVTVPVGVVVDVGVGVGVGTPAVANNSPE